MLGVTRGQVDNKNNNQVNIQTCQIHTKLESYIWSQRAQPLEQGYQKCELGTQQGNEYRNEKQEECDVRKEQEVRTILQTEILGSVLDDI